MYMWVTKDDNSGLIKKWYNNEPIKSSDGIWFSPIDFPCIETKLSIEDLIKEGYLYLE